MTAYGEATPSNRDGNPSDDPKPVTSPRAKNRVLIVNRFIWAVIFVGVCVGAWFTGERVLYLSAAVLVFLPAASLGISFFLLRRLRVSRKQPNAVLKQAEGTLSVGIHNNTFMPLGSVDLLINTDEHAITVLENQTVELNPFARRDLDISFQIEFRGQYVFGLAAVQLTDFTGLFKLSRYFDAAKTITCLPQVPNLSNFPLTMNLMTQASSRFDIRDEDYSTISDIRQYMPTDSIKRVHWKLTAKRNEWLVKNFQSNALNLVSIILDSTRQMLSPREVYALEDKMVGNALGLAKFCLGRGMPVDFIAARKTRARNPGEFDEIYTSASELKFTQCDCQGILSQELNDAAGYVNAVILTSRLSGKLYERIANGTNNGHYIAVLYFELSEPDEETAEIYNLLLESGKPCFKVETNE